MCDLTGILAATLLAILLVGMTVFVAAFELLAVRWREQGPRQYHQPRPTKGRKRKERP